MGSRTLKRQVLELCAGQDLNRMVEGLHAMAAKDAVNALFPLICRESPLLRWQAITCMGISVARLAEQEMEEARIVMRRFLWSLNDESGGIGWGAPEAMAESMCRHAGLAEEYVHMLLSYMREDGEEICQDGNYIEHPLLQRGLLWGVARMCACRPELLRHQGAAADLPPYLGAEHGEVRGLAALACGRLGVREAIPELQQLRTDNSEFLLYQEGKLIKVTVGQLTKQALAAMGG